MLYSGRSKEAGPTQWFLVLAGWYDAVRDGVAFASVHQAAQGYGSEQAECPSNFFILL